MRVPARRMTGVGMVLLLVLVCLFGYLRENEPSNPGSGRPLASGEGSARGLEVVEGRDASLEAAHSIDGRQVAGPRLEGYVLDDLFGVAVTANVITERRIGTTSDERTGSFTIDLSTSEWTQLQVSAPNYSTQVVANLEDSPSGEWMVRLKPSTWTTVLAEYEDGSPAVGLEVQWQAVVARSTDARIRDWIDTASNVHGRTVVQTTDSMGEVKLEIGTVALVTVRPSGESSGMLSYRATPGDRLRIQVPHQTGTLIVLDSQSLEPQVGLELDLWCPREVSAMTRRVITDRDGRATIHVTSLPILVRRPGALMLQSELLPMSPGMTPANFGGVSQAESAALVRIDGLPESKEWILGIRDSGLQLLLIDDATGEQINAPARVRRRNPDVCRSGDSGAVSACTALSPRSPFDDPEGVLRSSAGRLDVPCWVLHPSEASRLRPKPFDLVITATGYSTTVVPHDPSAPRIEGRPLEVRLQKAKARSVLVRYGDGAPYREELAFYSVDVDTLSLRSIGHDGLFGPFDWSRGDVLVEVQGRWNCRVVHSQLEASEVVTLTMESNHGSIALSGVPAGYPISELAAKSGTGPKVSLYRARSSFDGGCTFERLPPGNYIVGPKRWLDGVELQSIRVDEGRGITDSNSARVAVVSGETAQAAWNPSWSASTPIHGRIQVEGPGSARVVVMPWYSDAGAGESRGSEPARMIGLGRMKARIALDASGNYRIAEYDPVPALLAVAVLDDAPWGGINGMHVVEVFEPGMEATIELGGVELRWNGGSLPRPILVEYTVDELKFRHTARSHFTKCSTWWNTEFPLSLDGVPLSVKEVRVDGMPLRVEYGPDGWSRASVSSGGEGK